MPISPPSCISLPRPHPTPLGGHKALSSSPCAMRLLPTSYLFYIWYQPIILMTSRSSLKISNNACIWLTSTTQQENGSKVIYKRLGLALKFSLKPQEKQCCSRPCPKCLAWIKVRGSWEGRMQQSLQRRLWKLALPQFALSIQLLSLIRAGTYS